MKHRTRIIGSFLLALALSTSIASAQFGEMKIPHAARAQAGTVTLVRPAEMPLVSLAAGTYSLEVEYRSMRRVVVSFLRGNQVVAEGFGYLKGFPEAMNQESSPLSESARTLDWRDLGFGSEGSIEIHPAGNRDIVTIHPTAAFSDRGSIIVRLEPARSIERSEGAGPN